MYIEQKDLDALTDELLMEAFAQNNEGVSAKIFRNIHYQKFAEEAKTRLRNSALDQKIKDNQGWGYRHSFNIEEFEMDLRQVMKKHHVSYMRFLKGAAEVSLANSNGRMTLDVSGIAPERDDPSDMAPGYSDAWIANTYTNN